MLHRMPHLVQSWRSCFGTPPSPIGPAEQLASNDDANEAGSDIAAAEMSLRQHDGGEALHEHHKSDNAPDDRARGGLAPPRPFLLGHFAHQTSHELDLDPGLHWRGRRQNYGLAADSTRTTDSYT